METVLPAIVVLVVMLFAMLTEAYSFTAAQSRIQAGEQVMQERMSNEMRTALTAAGTQVNADGTEVDVTFRNSGTTRLIDFEKWDMIVRYYDTSHSAQALWLPYHTGGNPTVQEWSVVGLYMDADQSIAEVYEPGILNPGEEVVIRMRLPNEIEYEVAGLATLSTPNGISAPIFFTRPRPPTPTPEPTVEVEATPTEVP